jgi:hypothetical protein
MDIGLINQSSAVDDGQVRNIAAACTIQLREHVGPAWNIAEPIQVVVGETPGAYPFYLVDEIPEAPGALAYHTVEHGVPTGRIGVLTTLRAHESIESATSHEAVELQCDIFCASWSFSSRLGCLVATEACDPVQSESYEIDVNGTKVEVSNFVTPAYFADDPSGAKVDHLGSLGRSFDVARGGYQVQMKAGKVHNVFGQAFPDELKAAKAASRGRTFWRHVTMAVALMSAEDMEALAQG